MWYAIGSCSCAFYLVTLLVLIIPECHTLFIVTRNRSRNRHKNIPMSLLNHHQQQQHNRDPANFVDADIMDEKHAFRCSVVDLELPEPPMDVAPIDMTAAATDSKTISPPLDHVPARFNYVTARTTKISIGRDVNGNDFPKTDSINAANDDVKCDDDNSNGIGWFTNHRTIHVKNGRVDTDHHRYTLHTNGFELISLPTLQLTPPNTVPDSTISTTGTKTISDIDYTNRNDVLQLYYPYCQEFLRQALLQQYGDQVQVWAFDHNVRKQQLQNDSDTVAPNNTNSTTNASTTTTTTTTTSTVIQKPIGMVHGDYTTLSAPRRLQLLGEPPKINDIFHEQFKNQSNGTSPRTSLLDPTLIQECLPSSGTDTPKQRRRYAFINIWKNIDPHHPVMALPLGCVDATTVSMVDDLRTLELHYTDRIGENYLACHPSPLHARRQHQWVYYPQMTHDEVLLIKQWDSAGTNVTTRNDHDDAYTATFSLHSAFIDPTTPPNNTIVRQSIEVRCVVIWT